MFTFHLGAAIGYMENHCGYKPYPTNVEFTTNSCIRIHFIGGRWLFFNPNIGLLTYDDRDYINHPNLHEYWARHDALNEQLKSCVQNGSTLF